MLALTRAGFLHASLVVYLYRFGPDQLWCTVESKDLKNMEKMEKCRDGMPKVYKQGRDNA